MATARNASGSGRQHSQTFRERFRVRREQMNSRALMRSYLEELRSRLRSARHQMAREPAPAAEGASRRK